LTLMFWTNSSMCDAERNSNSQLQAWGLRDRLRAGLYCVECDVKTY